MKELLAIRKLLKRKKPTFIRQDAHKKKRVSDIWRKPRGRHNKMRLHIKGYARGRSTGYGSPVAVKGLSKQGLVQCVVTTLNDFANKNPKTDGIIISRTVGAKNRLALIDYAQKNNFTIINLDVDKVKQSIENQIAEKKSRKKDLLKRKETKEKQKKQAEKKKQEEQAKEKETAKAESVEEQSVVESKEQKSAEKKEHDKLLIKKDQV